MLPRIRNMLIEYNAAIQELEEVNGLRRVLEHIQHNDVNQGLKTQASGLNE